MSGNRFEDSEHGCLGGAITQPARCPLNYSLFMGIPSEAIPEGGWQLKAICWPQSLGHKFFLWGDLAGEISMSHHTSTENSGSTQPSPALLFSPLKTTFPQLWIPAINSISDSITRVCFHLPLLWIIILCFYIYDQLFKVPLERLTTAQLSIIAIIICLFVFRKQHRLGNVKTAFGVEQLCFGGAFLPLL